MTDYIKLGMMKAEFQHACKAIDDRAAEAEKTQLGAAWRSLMQDDLGGRDKACDKARDVARCRQEAKTEAWLRIGEKHGFDREYMERSISLN